MDSVKVIATHRFNDTMSVKLIRMVWWSPYTRISFPSFKAVLILGGQEFIIHNGMDFASVGTGYLEIKARKL